MQYASVHIVVNIYLHLFAYKCEQTGIYSIHDMCIHQAKAPEIPQKPALTPHSIHLEAPRVWSAGILWTASTVSGVAARLPRMPEIGPLRSVSFGKPKGRSTKAMSIRYFF